jgi:hypothetical protein
VPPAVSRGQEAREGRGGARGLLVKEEEGGGERKGVGGIGDVFYRCSKWQGKEGGGPGQSTRGRERRTERGGPSAAVGDRHQPVADGRERAVCARGIACDQHRNMGGRGLTGGPRYSPGRWRFEYISNSNDFKLL